VDDDDNVVPARFVDYRPDVINNTFTGLPPMVNETASLLNVIEYGGCFVSIRKRLVDILETRFGRTCRRYFRL